MTASVATLDFVERHSPKFTALADQIWNLAELRYEEFASAQLHIEMLEAAGFRVTRGVATSPRPSLRRPEAAAR